MSRRLRTPACLAVLAALCTVFVGARAADPGPDLVRRGEYLALAGDCVACHSAPGGRPMAGGLSLPTPLGAFVSTNITPSKTHGIGNYSLEQFSAALRRGIRADGAPLYPAMPYPSYALVTDDDVRALYAYFMQGVAPVDSAPPRTQLPFPFDVRASMRIWNALYLDDRAYQPVPGKDAEWNRGAYLVRGLTHCSTCHTPRGLLMAEDHARELAGGTVGPWEAPNITSDAASGIGGWGVDELVGYLQTGHASGKSQAAGPMAEAVDFSLRHLTSTDLRAIAAYLKTVPPVHDARDERPAHAWGQAGADLAALRGLAWPRDPEQLTGSQLYDAYCATCHQAGAEGSFDGGLPPLFHNTALGRTSAANLVLVILDGLHRQPDVFMPGFRGQLSDHQLATLAGYLTQRWGNPKATVSAEEVRKLRDGASGSSHLRTLARAGLAGAIVVLAAIVLWLARGTRRRTSLRQTT